MQHSQGNVENEAVMASTTGYTGRFSPSLTPLTPDGINSKAKPELTEAERLQKREEMARRRKRQNEQRLQDEQVGVYEQLAYVAGRAGEFGAALPPRMCSVRSSRWRLGGTSAWPRP